jgi:hypothetical protein
MHIQNIIVPTTFQYYKWHPKTINPLIYPLMSTSRKAISEGWFKGILYLTVVVYRCWMDEKGWHLFTCNIHVKKWNKYCKWDPTSFFFPNLFVFIEDKLCYSWVEIFSWSSPSTIPKLYRSDLAQPCMITFNVTDTYTLLIEAALNGWTGKKYLSILNGNSS